MKKTQFTNPQLNPQIRASEDVPDEVFSVPLDGQWMPGTHESLLGKNFKTMTNMRYVDGHPESVRGMTKVTSAPIKDGYRILTKTFSSPVDLTGKTAITFDIRASREGSNITLSFVDSGGVTTSKVVTIADADTWESKSWDISGVADANKNAITSLSIAVTDTTAQNTIYIDNMVSSGTTIDSFEYSSDAAAQLAYITASSYDLQCFSEGTIKITGSYSMKIVENGYSLKARSAFLFTKALHPEQHLLVQAFNQDATKSYVIERTTAIPEVGNFVTTPLWSDSDGADIGSFTDSPGGQLVYCNGIDNCIWSGIEARCAAFITMAATLSSASDLPTNPRDYTGIINNLSTDAENVVHIGTETDSSTKLLLHLNGTNGATTTTDASAGAHALTSRNGAALSTVAYKFGTASGAFDGSNDYWDIPDHDDFYFAAGPVTVDFHVKPTADGVLGICGQYADVNNLWKISIETTRWTTQTLEGTYTHTHTDLSTHSAPYYTVHYWMRESVSFEVVSGGVTIAAYLFYKDSIYYEATWYSCDAVPPEYSTPATENPPADPGGGGWIDGFKHVAFIRNGTMVDCYLNGVAMSQTITTAISTNPFPDLSDVFTFGRCTGSTGGDVYMQGYIDEFRISKGVARWIADFPVNTAEYAATSNFFLIATTRPASGFYAYLSTYNSTTSVLSCKEFTGGQWAAKAIVSDGTTSGGVAFAQNGKVSWGSTVNTSRQRYLEGYYLHWYLIELSAGGATLYHVTMDVPFQRLIDVWDGNFRSIAAAYKTITTGQTDITLNVNTPNAYLALDTSSYVDISSLTTSDSIEIGFTSKQTGLYLALPDGYTNTTADTAIVVEYWSGAAYVVLPNVSDGTSGGGISVKSSGIVSWSNESITEESKKSTGGSFPLYYYRIRFDKTLSSSVRLYYIAGIPVSNDISGYGFGIQAADRLMLGGHNLEYKNALKVSAQDRPEVMNGMDTQDITFGGAERLVGGASIFAQYSSSIYNIILIYKTFETWILQWNQSTTGVSWSRFCISTNVGLPAVRTLKIASVIFENNINQAKSIAIWRSHDGIYISNGQSPFKVSKDISTVFDQSSTVHVNLAMIDKEYGDVDKQRMEYHWHWASNNNTELDKEYILDLVRWRWFEVDRTSGKRIQCSVDVKDTSGSNYNYGFTDDGYAHRLEYGTTFDGVGIVSTLEFGAMTMLEKNISIETSIQKANIICVPKELDSVLTMTHSIDGASGTDYVASMSDVTHSFANIIKDVYSNPGVFHGIKLVTDSSQETKGFEPLYVTLTYQKIREHNF